MGWIIVAAAVFGGMFLLDKGFTKVFRDQAQHKTGLSVRLHKRYATAGILLAVLAVLTLFADFQEQKGLMIFAGLFIGAMAAGLLVYYMSFGIFYDDESFILTTFGKKSVAYRFCEVKEQRLYTTTGGGTIIELHMQDGRAVSLQSSMEGVYPFLDKAFFGWCRQKGIDPDRCEFHDPGMSCWFPGGEG